MASRYGLQIRSAIGADAAGIAAMMAAAGHPLPAADLETRLDAIRKAAGTVLLALEWGPPSGLVALTWFPTLGASGAVAQINTLVVSPDDRRRGIGRLLLKAAAQAARTAGCDELRLAVPGAASSLPLFAEATGFVRETDVFVRPLRKKG